MYFWIQNHWSRHWVRITEPSATCSSKHFLAHIDTVSFGTTNAFGVLKLAQFICGTEGFVMSTFAWLDPTISVASKTVCSSVGQLYRGLLYQSTLPVHLAIINPPRMHPLRNNIILKTRILLPASLILRGVSIYRYITPQILCCYYTKMICNQWVRIPIQIHLASTNLLRVYESVRSF